MCPPNVQLNLVNPTRRKGDGVVIGHREPAHIHFGIGEVDQRADVGVRIECLLRRTAELRIHRPTVSAVLPRGVAVGIGHEHLARNSVSGLVNPPLDPAPPVADHLLPQAVSYSDWALGALIVVGALGIVGGGVVWCQRSRARRNWPFLFKHLTDEPHLEEALREFRTLELLVGLGIPQVRQTEQAVALGVLQNRATTDLAQELACTVSHIYNLRASIRKKWNLDTDIPLSAALNQAQEEGRI